MVRDLSDAFGWLEKLERKVSRLYSGAMLENSSITNGRMRFIGGLLRLDSGARAEIVGTLQVEGTSRITGDTSITGPTKVTGRFNVEGPWNMAGPGEIRGNVDQTGDVTLRGHQSVTGGGEVVIGLGGRVRVNGANPITIGVDGAGRASIDFSTGYIVGDADGITIYPEIGPIIYLNRNGLRIAGLETRTAAATGLSPRALGADPDGAIYRVV